MVELVTVTTHDADFAPAVAVTVAVPAFTAVTRPSTTVTASPSTDHTTGLAFVGATVAVS